MGVLALLGGLLLAFNRTALRGAGGRRQLEMQLMVTAPMTKHITMMSVVFFMGNETWLWLRPSEN